MREIEDRGAKPKTCQPSLLTQTGTEVGCLSHKTDPSSLRFRLRPALRDFAVTSAVTSLAGAGASGQ